jgi:general stress protein 26
MVKYSQLNRQGAKLMKKSENEREEAIEKISKILSGAKSVYLATNGSHGHPNLRAMMPAKAEGASSVWFVTNAESSKVQELLKDPSAVLYASAPRNAGECRLWGKVEVLSDPASRKHAWNEAFKEHFPEGAEAENLRVLRFEASNGIYTNKNKESIEFKN